jgi:hypothetical protein
LKKKILKEAEIAMNTSMENYLIEIADSMKFSNPTFKDDDIESALCVVRSKIESIRLGT